MRYKTKLRTLLLLPSARHYLKKIMNELNNSDYKQVLEQPLSSFKESKVENIVKSYFWAARTIRNCRCLPRSIALYCHLKAIGYDVEHKIGVNKTEKLSAHSWVELNGKALNEHPDLYQRFTLLE